MQHSDFQPVFHMPLHSDEAVARSAIIKVSGETCNINCFYCYEKRKPYPGAKYLKTTLHRYVLLYNQQLPQSALGTKTPLQVMKDWHRLKPELFRKQPYQLPGCDKYVCGRAVESILWALRGDADKYPRNRRFPEF
jgi:hypothetical protein